PPSLSVIPDARTRGSRTGAPLHLWGSIVERGRSAMTHRACLICIVSVLFALPTLAQDAGPEDAGAEDAGLEDDAGALDAGDEGDDAGPGSEDGGTADCTPRCDGEVLRFCDDGTPVELDCSETGATCGILSEEWGADCL